MATVFHLIRHGHYGQLGVALAGRTAGYSLSEAGRAQSEAVARDLEGQGIAAIYSSPMERALETAAPIGVRLGLDVRQEDDLNEVDFGAWQGMTFDALHAQPEWRAFNRFRSASPVPGGETILEVQARVVRRLIRLRAEWPDAALALVSHGDVIKAAVAYFLAVPLDLFRRIEIEPASRSVIVVHDTDAAVQTVNRPPSG